MKQKRKPMSVRKKLMISVLLVIPTLFILAMLQNNNYKELLKSQKEDDPYQSGENTSSEEIYTSDKVLKYYASGIPSGNNTKSFNEVGIKWSRNSVADGSDTCFIYDKKTYQIYARTFTTSGFNFDGTIESGTTYYKNKLVSKDKAEQILKDYCYKYN